MLVVSVAIPSIQVVFFNGLMHVVRGVGADVAIPSIQVVFFNACQNICDIEQA